MRLIDASTQGAAFGAPCVSCVIGLTVSQLKLIAKQVGGSLTNASKKREIVQRLLALSAIGVLGVGTAEQEPLSYLTEEISQQLDSLPSFKNITDWRKSLEGIAPIHFVNLYCYLVESRDKTFDQQSLRAFKSMKGYQFCRPRWLCEEPGGVSSSIH